MAEASVLACVVTIADRQSASALRRRVNGDRSTAGPMATGFGVRHITENKRRRNHGREHEFE
jgi:hypothetical protein